MSVHVHVIVTPDVVPVFDLVHVIFGFSLSVQVDVYVAFAVGGFVTVPNVQEYPVLVGVGTLIVPPVQCAYNVAPPALTHCLLAFVYPFAFATSFPLASITLVPPLADVYHPSNVQVLVLLDGENVAVGVPDLNVIV